MQPWHVKDVNGLILVWHHLGGQPPAWDIAPIPEFGADDWTPYEARRWKIRTHNQEMAENAVDSAHFHYVHGTLEMPTSRAHVDGHVLRVVSDTLMKTPMGKVKGQVESISHGFGYALTRFTGIVETLLVASTTPIDDDFVDVRFSFTVKKLPSGDATSTVGGAFIREIERQLGSGHPHLGEQGVREPPAPRRSGRAHRGLPPVVQAVLRRRDRVCGGHQRLTASAWPRRARWTLALPRVSSICLDRR